MDDALAPDDVAALRAALLAHLETPLTAQAAASASEMQKWPVQPGVPVRGSAAWKAQRPKAWPLDAIRRRRVRTVAGRMARRVPVATKTVRWRGREVSRPARYGGWLPAQCRQVLWALTEMVGPTGRAMKGIADIARLAGLPYSTTYRWLKYMRLRCMIDWLSQAEVGMEANGTLFRRQTENEYVIRPPEEWMGYAPGMEAQAPHPSTYGATPALPGADTDDTAAEAKARAEVKAALDRLGRAVRGRGGG